GEKVAVVGGGNVAIDVARTCRRMGADVTILYRRERKDMPAYEDEIEDALEEGIELRVLVAPKSIGKQNGRLVFELDECELREFDASGRRRPVPIEGCVLAEEYDTIFAAIGQAPDLTFSRSIESGRNTLKNDSRTLATNLPGVFAGGDAVTGPARVVDALAAGRRAAEEIDKYLSGMREEPPHEGSREEITITMKVPEEVIKQPMVEMPKLPAEERIKDFAEVELGLDEEAAKKECGRCLRCDVKLD
ncbi:MAG: FAD-dependent oxidoreductase, partial [Deltaproteobacteria bacterium]